MTATIIFIIAAGGAVLGFLIAIAICAAIMKYR
jgi:hypothetical protein